jgi:hypothetical protein
MTMPEQKKAVVPRLRFPEFRDAGPWEVKRLGDVAEVNAAGDLDFSQYFSSTDARAHLLRYIQILLHKKGYMAFLPILSTGEK